MRPPGAGEKLVHDHTINPDAERFGYECDDLTTLEIKSSCLVMLSRS